MSDETGKIKMIPLDSSNLASAGYDPENELLRVQFHNGQVWEYSGVPESKFIELTTAPSAGRYFAAAIRGVYSERRVA